MSAWRRHPRANALSRENERLRQELADKDKQIHRLAEPPSSDGLAGEGRQRAGGRRAGERRVDSPAIAERIGLWYQPKEPTRCGPCCRSSASIAAKPCRRRSSKCRPPARCSGIK